MKSTLDGGRKSFFRGLTAIPLLVCAGALYAADYCCVCRGQAKGETISATNLAAATNQCTRQCRGLTFASAGKCAQPPAATTPAPQSAQPAPAPAAPKDFLAVAPGAKVLADNGQIRVIDFQPAAGTKLPLHSHPTTVVYALEGGTMRFTTEDGRWREIVGRSGDVVINTPDTHSQEHITGSHAILIEIAESAKFEPVAPSTSLGSVAPEHARVVAENDRVRVYEYRAMKGDAVGMHAHSTYVVYFIKGGKTQFVLEDGSIPRPIEPKDGTALINPPVTHAQVHLEDMHAIIVELKR